jgi:hypothetical protein
MRLAPVLRDELFRMVNNSGLAIAARAGAAAALGFNAAPSERERLRDVVDRVASPKLRVVLEAAADSDQGKLEAALDAVDEPRVPHHNVEAS